MIKVALPAGSLRAEAAAFLARAGLPVPDYGQGSRSYRFQEGGLLFRVFREPDIPIQVALGSYDLGLCRPAWVEERLGPYPGHDVVRLGSLGFGHEELFVAAAQGPLAERGFQTLAGIQGLRIISEYPSLAEAFALSARLGAYRVFPVWGAAEVYPPEDADLAVVAAADAEGLAGLGLRPLFRLFAGSCALIAHRRSLREKELAPVLGPLLGAAKGYDGDGLGHPTKSQITWGPGLALPGPLPRPAAFPGSIPVTRGEGIVRLALPDGHQQPHALAALAAAGLAPAGYAPEGPRRLAGPLPYLQAKVLRPQDMPQQVALGGFDLAITGRDWLQEHLYRFPRSPVAEVADLGRGRYRLAAVVSETLPAATIGEALKTWRGLGRPLRLASEYAHIADHYARTRHLGRYQVIPISGASEGFVPEDADLLIEGAETGQTLAANGLKILESLFESTTCLIASQAALAGPRGPLLEGLIQRLREAPTSVGATAAADAAGGTPRERRFRGGPVGA